MPSPTDSAAVFTSLRVLHVASECVPFVKTGGLADVVGALPAALAVEGVGTRVLLPGYPAVMEALPETATASALGDLFGGPARLVAGTAAGIDVIALDAPHLFDRPGSPYLGPDRADWPDNAIRFGALARVAAQIGLRGLDGWHPHVVHAHDWQAGLVPEYLAAAEKRPATVMTIHNVAFQGVFPATTAATLGLDPAGYTPEGYEYFEQISLLKAGLVRADKITTVSPTYARELTTPAFGMGLEGVLAARRGDLNGVLNGIDTTVWDPGTDAAIRKTYSSPSGRSANRTALAKRFGLTPRDDRPMFCVISRLTRQKGLDLLLDALDPLMDTGSCLALLGSGDLDLEDGFRAAAARHPGRVGVEIGYDEALSHSLMGGADAILIPSRFEPCGLTQLYGLRYGCVPVVARTGGLADTIIDANPAALAVGIATGLQHAPDDREAMIDAIGRAATLFANRTVWRKMQRRGMAHPVGWDSSARAYADLYRAIV